jgi:hypothetical protein
VHAANQLVNLSKTVRENPETIVITILFVGICCYFNFETIDYPKCFGIKKPRNRRIWYINFLLDLIERLNMK